MTDRQCDLGSRPSSRSGGWGPIAAATIRIVAFLGIMGFLGSQGVLSSARTIAHAQGDAATASVVRMTVDYRPSLRRAGAPYPLRLQLQHTGAGLIVGRLGFSSAEVTGHDGYLTDPITIGPDPQTFRFLIPAQDFALRLGALWIKVDFRTEDGARSGLGRIEFRRSDDDDRLAVVVASYRDRNAAAPAVDARRLDPVEWLGRTEVQECLEFGVEAFSAEDVPSDPLEYCAYDAVWIDGSAFHSLDASTLSALETWIRAGGVACIRGREGLGADPRDFLDRLGVAHRAAGGDDDLSAPFLHWSVGRGRVLLVDPSVDVDATEWDAALEFVWGGSRHDVSNDLRRQGGMPSLSLDVEAQQYRAFLLDLLGLDRVQV
ncbi:MAG: hypothetical protein KDC38_17570, partial [Planctomycetes bacterium]|nr:hypothetical protein [Planctomycetota bacterium]